jgi:hypothetical protein
MAVWNVQESSLKQANSSWVVVAQAFSPRRQKQRQVNLWFKASLVYRVSSRTARATQRNPVSEKKRRVRLGSRHLES